MTDKLDKYFKSFERVDKQRYRLTVTGKQARYIQEACDLYERLHAGQWWHLANTLPLKHNVDQWTFSDLMHNLIEPMLNKNDMRFERISGDIGRVIRHRLSWDIEPQGGITVNFNEPFAMSDEPLATIEQIKDEQ